MFTPMAAAYRFAGGPAPGADQLNLIACASAAKGALGVQVHVDKADGAGQYTMGNVDFTDMNGGTWGTPMDPFAADFSVIQMVGGYVDGDFKANVTHGGNAAHSLQGKFHLCHVNDILAP